MLAGAHVTKDGAGAAAPRRHVLLAGAMLLISILLLAQPALAATDPVTACLKTASSTADLDDCVGAAYVKAKKQLGSVYAKLLAGKGLAPGDRRLLVQAQKKWELFRAADCSYAESLNKGGTLAPVTRGICLVRDTTDRADVLRDYLSTS